MGNLRQFRSLLGRVSVGRTTVALAVLMVFVLTVVTSQAAHAQGYQIIYTFTGGNDGAQPYAGVTFNRTGDLFGTTYAGNSGVNWGNVYELLPEGAGWVYDHIQLFDGTLSSRVVFGPNQTLYGTSPNQLTTYHYGYIYNLRPPISAICRAITCPWLASIIYGFSGGSDGGDPRYGDLIFDAAGDIYGTTAGGGAGYGVAYEMMNTSSGWTEQPIYTFAGPPDGAVPFAGLLFDSVGNLYGTTTQGGSTGNGAVYELSPSSGGWTEQILYNFQGAGDGNNPTGGLIFDPSGNLYGTSNNGGANGGGTVFELSPSGGGNWTYNLLYSFSGSTNCGPFATLAIDASGNLYGTTICDGANNEGNVWELSPSSGGWTYTSLHDFSGSDGRRPYSNVSFNAAGNMFGTASRGGSYDAGLVWEIMP